MSRVRIALLITTYNRPDALDLVLESVAKQSQLPDEIIICDDGSDLTTSEVVASWSSRLPISHAWSPDMNFRAALTRNLGVLKSRAEILVFVDGDCLLPTFFIERHLELAQPGYLISGGRFLLSPNKTNLILNRALAFSVAFDNWKFLSWQLGFFRDLRPRNWASVRTCNISIYREDVLKISGFDETYVGWGREDSDFVVRLMRSGIKIRSGRLATCVAHLYHHDSPRDRLSVNEQKFRETLNRADHILANSSSVQQ